MLYLSCKKISAFVFIIYADTILLGNGNDINTLIQSNLPNIGLLVWSIYTCSLSNWNP